MISTLKNNRGYKRNIINWCKYKVAGGPLWCTRTVFMLLLHNGIREGQVHFTWFYASNGPALHVLLGLILLEKDLDYHFLADLSFSNRLHHLKGPRSLGLMSRRTLFSCHLKNIEDHRLCPKLIYSKFIIAAMEEDHALSRLTDIVLLGGSKGFASY